MKILGVSGSPRKDGNTDTVLDELLKGAREAGAETEKIFLRDQKIHSCIGCERCRKDLTCTRFPDSMQEIYPRIEKADTIILGSPTYNYNITPETKAFIDRLYPYYIFAEKRPGPYKSRFTGQNKKALVYTVAEQKKACEKGFANDAMKKPLEALGIKVIETLELEGYFKIDAIQKDREQRKKMRAIGKRLAKNR